MDAKTNEVRKQEVALVPWMAVDSLFQKTPIIFPFKKIELFSQEMHPRIT
jgi:hypothetical protein